MKKVIKCEIHDYFESACVYRYCLRIKLSGGDEVLGNAKTIIIKEKNEFLILNSNIGEALVNLTEINQVDVLTEGAKFKSIPV